MRQATDKVKARNESLCGAQGIADGGELTAESDESRIAFYAEDGRPVFLRNLSPRWFLTKPCPFCGTLDTYLQASDHDLYVSCAYGCIICGPKRRTILDAIGAWNRRSLLTSRPPSRTLKSCPFCGPGHRIEQVEPIRVFLFSCTRCQATSGGCFDVAIARWNKRSLFGRIPWKRRVKIGKLPQPLKEELLLAGLRAPLEEAETTMLESLSRHNKRELERVRAIHGGTSDET